MSLATDDLPPVPQHTSPIQEDIKSNPKFHQAWLGWFIQAREKINLINSSIRNLSQLVAGGFAVKDTDGTWTSRTITGTADRIEVTNGDGIAGDPAIDIASTYEGQTSIVKLGTVTTGTWQGTKIGIAYLNILASAGTPTGGAAPALPAQPVGYLELQVGGVTKKIPYYD